MHFLQFSRPERHGAVMLIICCLCAAATPVLIRHFYRPPAPDFSAFNQLVAGYQEAMAVKSSSALFEFDPNTVSEAELVQLGLSPRVAATVLKYRTRGGRFRRPEDLCRIHGISAEDCSRLQPYMRIVPENRQVAGSARSATAAERFPFDPNTATTEDLARLGIPKWVVQNIARYREKGGRFRSKADLGKIYGMQEDLLAALEPFVAISEPELTAAPKPVAYMDKTPTTRVIRPVDINRDGPEAWDQLPGIGASRARQIIAFREKLGGFVSVEHVAETRGLPDSVFQAIRPFLTASPIVRMIRLNTATKEELAEHPYLSFKQADLIIAYRAQHGPFQHPDDIRKIPPLRDAAWLEKISPYLSLE